MIYEKIKKYEMKLAIPLAILALNGCAQKDFSKENQELMHSKGVQSIAETSYKLEISKNNQPRFEGKWKDGKDSVYCVFSGLKDYEYPLEVKVEANLVYREDELFAILSNMKSTSEQMILNTKPSIHVEPETQKKQEK